MSVSTATTIVMAQSEMEADDRIVEDADCPGCGGDVMLVDDEQLLVCKDGCSFRELQYI